MKTRALLVLGVVFFGSFIGRIAVLASEASGKTAAGVLESDAAPAGACVDGEIAAAVKDRMYSLDRRETALSDRETELKTYEAQIEKRLAELEKANGELQDKIKVVKDARNEDVAKLAAIYEGMKPNQAGQIINEMDPKFAAGLLSAMNNEQAALVVANMDAQKAYLVSVILANRSQQLAQ